MGDMLSQAEIDALLSGATTGNIAGDANIDDAPVLTSQEIDALGEIGNISMGTSATTLFTLLGQKVIITTPKVTITTWDELSKKYPVPFVAVKVEYTHGLSGSNLMIMKEKDVKVITDLMMGGDGSKTDGELNDLHFSAISEAMNQMVGSSSTSMSSMFDKRIDISPPEAFMMNLGEGDTYINDEGAQIVQIAFKMIIGDLIDSEIMQILPVSFAKTLVDNLLNSETESGTYNVSEQTASTPEPPVAQHPQVNQADIPASIPYNYEVPADMEYSYESPSYQEERKLKKDPVNVRAAQFQSMDNEKIVLEKRNISLIMDVPLQVTVELGRTHKKIRDILEFGPGSIIELDKLAGEPVDILVNGKSIAKGEVVVIDESFGVRITDILHPSKRL